MPYHVLLNAVIFLVLLSEGLMGMAVSASEHPLCWRWSNPLPHGGNIVDMALGPTTFLLVQVAERGQLYSSADAELWLPRDTHTTNSLRGVAFFGGRLVVTGINGCVLYADDLDDFQTGTLLDGPTSNWLEAVAASSTLCVAVGDRGAIYTSRDGMAWKLQNTGISTWLRGVAYGGGNFVAVGEDGFVATSPNGTNWTTRAKATTNHLNRVSWTPSRFTAVGEKGVLLTSTNLGTNWYRESLGITSPLYSASGFYGQRIAVGQNEVRIQRNGVWQDEIAKTNGPARWTYLSSVGRGLGCWIAGRTGMQAEGSYTTATNLTWRPPFNSIRNWLFDVAYPTNLYVAVGDFGTVMTSDNGVNWHLEAIPTNHLDTTFLGIGGSTNLLLAVGNDGRAIFSPHYTTNIVVTNLSGMVLTQTVSTLGVLWFNLNRLNTTNDLQGVAAQGTNCYVITGANGTILASTNGVLWSKRPAATSKLLSSVTVWPGGFVTTGDDGAILTSPDGFTWNTQNSGTLNWLYRVRYLNKTLVAAGQNGTILTSTNGTQWTPRNSGTTRWLTDVTFVTNTWFVTGFAGTVLTSSNLVNWVNAGTLTTKDLYSAATDGLQLVIAGVEGVILRSQIVPDPTPVSVLDFIHSHASANVARNIYLFGGKTDQQFTLDRSFVLPMWKQGTALEIFSPDGTLYYIEDLSSTNLPAAEFYRPTLTNH